MGKYTKMADIFFINNREVNGVKEHKCTQCGEWKPETEEYYYWKNKSKPEKGFKSECKECTKKNSYEFKWANIEMAYEADRKYKERNKEKIKNEKKIWRANNVDRYTETRDKWLMNHPDKVQEYQNNKRHKQHDITKEEWESCKKYFDYKCAYCDIPLSEHYVKYAGELRKQDFHKEHVNHEGEKDLSNCVPACKMCNSYKWEFEFDDWYNENNPNFTQERYDKIMKWINTDYKQYIRE